MKINFILLLIAIAISSILAYALYGFSVSENKMLFCAGGFICFATTLIIAFSVKFSLLRTTFNIRALSIVFFILLLISNFTFLFVVFLAPAYILTNGILLLIYILIAYSIYRAKQ
jgi:hypothetical protein